MTEPKQLALDFARVVMGWHAAAMNRGGDYCEQNGTRFWPRSINQVLDHVLNWCNENDATFGLHCDGSLATTCHLNAQMVEAYAVLDEAMKEMHDPAATSHHRQPARSNTEEWMQWMEGEVLTDAKASIDELDKACGR